MVSFYRVLSILNPYTIVKYQNGRIKIWIRHVCYKEIFSFGSRRLLWLLAVSTILTVFSVSESLSDDTLYIGGSGKIAVQVDLSVLDIGMVPNPVQHAFEFTNSLNTVDTSALIQLKAPAIAQSHDREETKNQLKLSKSDGSKLNKKPKTEIVSAIDVDRAAKRSKSLVKVDENNIGTPDRMLNSGKNTIEETNSHSSFESSNKTIPQVSNVTLTIGKSWKIPFIAQEAELPSSSLNTLIGIATALNQNDEVRIQLKAYAANYGDSASHARRLSLTRALTVRSFLIENGVRSTRIDVRALGNKAKNGKSDRVDVFVIKR